MFATYHQTCQPTISSSTVNFRRADALPPTGSVHLVGQGRPGYNRWKRITGAQSTRCGHRHRIARCGGRYGPRWSGAAVTEWVMPTHNSICSRSRMLLLRWWLVHCGWTTSCQSCSLFTGCCLQVGDARTQAIQWLCSGYLAVFQPANILKHDVLILTYKLNVARVNTISGDRLFIIHI